MKTILKTFAVACLFCSLAMWPSRAQTNTPLEAAPMAINQIQIEQLKLQLQKDLERDRLNQEKEIASARYNSERSMVHDLAWNSWVIFVIAIFFFGYLRDRRRHETIRLMIEKGTPITPELLQALRKKSCRSFDTKHDPRGYLSWGITLTLVGIALLIAFSHGGARVAGWIVLAVGVADLILWRIDQASSNSGQPK